MNTNNPSRPDLQALAQQVMAVASTTTEPDWASRALAKAARLLSHVAHPIVVTLHLDGQNMGIDRAATERANLRTVREICAMPEEETPRTPETVLRAMLLAAEQKALATSVTELTGESYPSSLRDAEEAVSRIRRVLGHFLATGRLDLGGFDYGLSSQEREEYEARLSGARPLDAPPPGTSS